MGVISKMAETQAESVVNSSGLSGHIALQRNFSDIVTAISVSNPLKVGDDLFTASLISQETLDKLELPTNTDYVKSRILVMSVLKLVKLAPAKLEAFMEVLRKSIDQSSYKGESFSFPNLADLPQLGNQDNPAIIIATAPDSPDLREEPGLGFQKCEYMAVAIPVHFCFLWPCSISEATY